MSLQKSSSISSIDSGLDHSTKKKLKNKSSVGHKESSLQSKNEINRNMSKELETESYCSQFSPLAFSTQVKKSESTSQSSDEGEMHSGGIVRVKQFKSSDSDTELPVNTGRNKEPKIHIIDNCLINSKKELNLKEEVDSDSKSVISVRRPSYVVTSETNSEDDDSQERSSGSKSKRKKKRKSIQENLSVGQTTKYHIKLNQNNEIDNREQNLNNSSSLEDNKLQTFNSNKLKKIADRKISLYQNEDDSSDTDGDHSDQRNSGNY
ncbi:hypothetical protein HHI36_007850 [Cryptolaemus montrouzieri]|uniref:Uncharacterized protein n=1 Tax=Cryptolaemus montrouzieri TaxID=559131 RepID=A0ABD2MQY8_9CUCU